MNRIASIESNILAPVSSDSWSEDFVLDNKLKEVAGYPDYLISESGEVYSKKGRGLKKMKQQVTERGYRRITLVVPDGHKKVSVHRLVAKAYVYPYEGESVHHINFVRSDNRKSNLRWVTTNYNRINTRSRIVDCTCIHGKRVRHNQKGLTDIKEFHDV